MSETVKVDLEENSKYRVAYDLMWDIARNEGSPKESEGREYFLRLYRQCIENVGRSRSIEEIIKGSAPNLGSRPTSQSISSW